MKTNFYGNISSHTHTHTPVKRTILKEGTIMAIVVHIYILLCCLYTHFFTQLARRYLRGSIRCLQRCEWSVDSCKKYAEMLTDADGKHADINIINSKIVS